jgi:hypothetical protein
MEIRCINGRTVLLKGRKESLLVNPTREVVDINKTQSRVIAFTSKKYDCLGLTEGDKVVLRGPGEYEVGGVEILGINAGNGDTVYVINVDGVTVGVLGEITEVLSDKRIERINAVDVLLAPVGGDKIVGGKIVLSWAKKWGANYLIPVGGEANTEEMKKFLDEVDREDLQPIESLKIDKENLPEGLEIVWIR